MPKPTLGSIVGGKYRLVRPLGEGGMGTVYEAEHVLTLKRAALKWVHPHGGCSETSHARLLREAQATSRIRHRHVVDVYDVLREDDAVCLVMELLEGEPLSERMARAPMALHELIQLLLPAMDGVAAAHAAGVVHRDIKPENIFLACDSDQRVVPKIIDFGISKLSDPAVPHLTHSGVTMGTPRYVSYEQLLGARDVDARADVYSFGVLLYEAITGMPPYRARSFGEQAVAFAMTVPTPPRQLRPALPAALDDLVQRAMAKERRLRLGSMREFMEALAPFAEASAYPEPLSTCSTRADVPAPDLPDPGKTTAPATPTADLASPVTLSAISERPRVRRRRAALVASLMITTAGLLGGILMVRRSDGPLPPVRAAARELAPRVRGPSAARDEEASDSVVLPGGPTAGAQQPPAHENPVREPVPQEHVDPGALSSPTPEDPERGASEPARAEKSRRNSAPGARMAHPSRMVGAQRTAGPRAAPRRHEPVVAGPAAGAGSTPALEVPTPPRAPVQPASAFAFSVAAEAAAAEPAAKDKDAPSATHRAGPLSRDEF